MEASTPIMRIVIEARQLVVSIADASGTALVERRCPRMDAAASCSWHERLGDVLADVCGSVAGRVGRVVLVPALTDDPPLGPVGVVLVGYPETSAARVAVPARLSVRGGISSDGEATQPVDLRALEGELPRLVRSAHPKAVAVSGMHSPLNPAQEAQAAECVRTVIHLPVVEARYLPSDLSAVRRAIMAASAADLLLTAGEVARSIRACPPEKGLPPPVLACENEGILNLLVGPEVAGEQAWPGLPPIEAHAVRVRARVVRSDQRDYLCLCDDGRHRFAAPGEARAFAEQHVREVAATRARRIGLDAPSVEVHSEDRFAHGRGRRGPMRVFLETRVTARAHG